MSLSITVNRDYYSLTPLVLSGDPELDTVIQVSRFQPPVWMPRVTYAPESPDVPGLIPLAWSYQTAILGFDVFPVVEDEAALEEARTELIDAVSQPWPWELEVSLGDGAVRTYRCHPGSVDGATRDYVNLRDFNPVWPVTIPCFPIPEG